MAQTFEQFKAKQQEELDKFLAQLTGGFNDKLGELGTAFDAIPDEAKASVFKSEANAGIIARLGLMVKPPKGKKGGKGGGGGSASVTMTDEHAKSIKSFVKKESVPLANIAKHVAVHHKTVLKFLQGRSDFKVTQDGDKKYFIAAK